LNNQQLKYDTQIFNRKRVEANRKKFVSAKTDFSNAGNHDVGDAVGCQSGS
jgi:hypothetical protein